MSDTPTQANQNGINFAPADWESYIGQEKVKDLIQMKIKAAMLRYEQLDHCLLVGESGSGKTSLANLIAAEHSLPFLPLMITPNFKINTLNKFLIDFSTENEYGGIVLMDEVHCFNKEKQHYLFSMLNEHCISLDNGKKIFFPTPITIVAATTEMQMLVKPLIGRFTSIYRLDDYSEIEMAQIVERMARKVGLSPTRDTCVALGRASAGSPRQAQHLIRIARDLGSLDPKPILAAGEITEDGLTVDHIAYLKSLNDLGMKAGIENISNHSGRSKDIVKDLEKLLVKKHYVEIGSGGRELMPIGNMALKRIQTTTNGV